MKIYLWLIPLFTFINNGIYSQTVNKASFSCFNVISAESDLQIIGGQVLAGESESSSNVLHGFFPLVDYAVGVEENTTSELVVFPTIFHSSVYLQSSSFTEALVVVSNMEGAVVMQQQVNSFPFRLDLSAISSGIYLVKIIDNESKVVVKKIIKQ